MRPRSRCCRRYGTARRAASTTSTRRRVAREGWLRGVAWRSGDRFVIEDRADPSGDPVAGHTGRNVIPHVAETLLIHDAFRHESAPQNARGEVELRVGEAGQ